MQSSTAPPSRRVAPWGAAQERSICRAEEKYTAITDHTTIYHTHSHTATRESTTRRGRPRGGTKIAARIGERLRREIGRGGRPSKGGRRLVHHTPLLKIPVWWRRAVLSSIPPLGCPFSFFYTLTHTHSLTLGWGRRTGSTPARGPDGEKRNLRGSRTSLFFRGGAPLSSRSFLPMVRITARKG